MDGDGTCDWVEDVVGDWVGGAVAVAERVAVGDWVGGAVAVAERVAVGD